MRISKKTKGIIFTITAITVVILLTLSLCLYFMLFVYGAYQPYSPNQRQVLMRSFDEVNYSPETSVKIKRVINNENPINFINYQGDEKGLVELWLSLPADVRNYTAVVINFDNILRPGFGGLLDDADKLVKTCQDNSIMFVAEVLTGSSQHEWLIPITYIEDKFLSHPNCLALGVNRVYSASNSRGLLDGNFSGYIADLIRISAKYGEYLIWSDCNIFGDNGTLIDWVENNEYLYSTMLDNSSNIVMIADNTDYARSTYSLILGMYLSGLIGNWGIATDITHMRDTNNSADAVNGINTAGQKSSPANDVLRYDSIYLAAAYGASSYLLTNAYEGGANALVSSAFKYSVMPFLKSVFKDNFTLPDRQAVLNKIKFAVVGGKNFTEADRDKNSADFSVSDYGMIPLLPSNLQSQQRQIFTDNKIQLIETELTRDIAKQYLNNENDNIAYFDRTGKNWYFVNTSTDDTIPNVAVADKFYTCGAISVSIVSSTYTNAMIIENPTSLKFAINNYLNLDKSVDIDETTQLRKTVITVLLDAGEVPNVEFAESNDYTAYYTQQVIYDGNKAIITIMHNGSVEFTVSTGAPKGLLPPSKSDVDNYEYERNTAYDYTTFDDTIYTIDYLMTNRSSYTNIGAWKLMNYKFKLERAVTEQNLTDDELNSLKADYSYQYALLINIDDQVRMLKQYKDIGDSKLDKAFDMLLREILSPTDYVEGKENGDILGFPYAKNEFEHNLKKTKLSEINKAQKILHSALLEKGLYTL